MGIKNCKNMAQSEQTVSKLYQNHNEATTYIANRFSRSWQKLLHETQVRCVENFLNKNTPANVLEIAPGPARIAVDLTAKAANGYMVEYSKQMIEVAEQRLHEADRYDNWSILYGNALN